MQTAHGCSVLLGAKPYVHAASVCAIGDNDWRRISILHSMTASGSLQYYSNKLRKLASQLSRQCLDRNKGHDKGPDFCDEYSHSDIFLLVADLTGLEGCYIVYIITHSSNTQQDASKGMTSPAKLAKQQVILYQHNMSAAH